MDGHLAATPPSSARLSGKAKPSVSAAENVAPFACADALIIAKNLLAIPFGLHNLNDASQ